MHARLREIHLPWTGSYRLLLLSAPFCPKKRVLVIDTATVQNGHALITSVLRLLLLDRQMAHTTVQCHIAPVTYCWVYKSLTVLRNSSLTRSTACRSQLSVRTLLCRMGLVLQNVMAGSWRGLAHTHDKHSSISSTVFWLHQSHALDYPAIRPSSTRMQA